MPTSFPTPMMTATPSPAVAELMALLQSLQAGREVATYFKDYPDPVQLQISVKLPLLPMAQSVTLDKAYSAALQSLIATNHDDLEQRAIKLIQETYGEVTP
jgi:hypothetical protein